MRIAAAAVVLAGLLLAVLPASFAGAVTCSLLSIPDARERLDLRLEESSELVFIGSVIDEVPVSSELVTSSTGATVVKTFLRNDANLDPEVTEYQSSVRVEAVLKGSPPADVLVLPYLYENYSCAGGPRLAEGERYLFVLAQDYTWIKDGNPQELFWSAGPTGGNILLADGQAYLDDYQSEAYGGDLGTDEEVVRYAAMKVGTGAEARDTALAALGLPVPAQDKGFSWAWLGAVVTVAVWVALAAIVLLRTRSKHHA